MLLRCCRQILSHHMREISQLFYILRFFSHSQHLVHNQIVQDVTLSQRCLSFQTFGQLCCDDTPYFLQLLSGSPSILFYFVFTLHFTVHHVELGWCYAFQLDTRRLMKIQTSHGLIIWQDVFTVLPFSHTVQSRFTLYVWGLQISTACIDTLLLIIFLSTLWYEVKDQAEMYCLAISGFNNRSNILTINALTL